MTRKGTEVLNLAGPVVPASEVQLISLFSSVFVPICLWHFILDSYIQILGIHLQTTITIFFGKLIDHETNKVSEQPDVTVTHCQGFCVDQGNLIIPLAQFLLKYDTKISQNPP
jgi:hypothetical protein